MPVLYVNFAVPGGGGGLNATLLNRFLDFAQKNDKTRSNTRPCRDCLVNGHFSPQVENVAFGHQKCTTFLFRKSQTWLKWQGMWRARDSKPHSSRTFKPMSHAHEEWRRTYVSMPHHPAPPLSFPSPTAPCVPPPPSSRWGRGRCLSCRAGRFSPDRRLDTARGASQGGGRQPYILHCALCTCSVQCAAAWWRSLRSGHRAAASSADPPPTVSRPGYVPAGHRVRPWTDLIPSPS